MAIEEIRVKQGTRTTIGAGVNIGLLSARGEEDGSPQVVLVVQHDGERDLTLCPGDTFSVGDQTWRLDRVEKANPNKLGAVFSRIA